MAETVVDITIGDDETTIIVDNDSTSGYYFESTIGMNGAYFTEAKRTIDLWIEDSTVDMFMVTDEWAGGFGYMDIETYFESDEFETWHWLHMAGHWIGGTQTVSNGLGSNDSDLWIDNRVSAVEGELFIDTDYLNYGEHRLSAYADYDVHIQADELWFESHGTYTEDYGGLEYMSSHAWGDHNMEFGIDDYNNQEYAFSFTAEAHSDMSEAYIRFLDFSVIPQDCEEEFFHILLDIFWSNMYGDPEFEIFAYGYNAVEGPISISIGPPPPHIVINGWLKGW
jgi:hypothetical protein